MATLFDKIWDRHVLAGKEGEAQLLYVDGHLIHEVTSPQAFSGLRLTGRKLRRPDLTYAVMDHNTPTTKKERENITDTVSKKQLDALRKNCDEFGVVLYDMDSEDNAIIHMMGPELGVSLPGKVIVCGDSHTATHGAFGAIACGIGTSEVEHVFATQTLWQAKPKNLGVRFCGSLPRGVYAKDMILALIGTYGNNVGKGSAIEFFGEAVEQMSMDERMTLCNMAIEAGAKFGLVRPDETTFAYVKDRRFAPKGDDFTRATAEWKKLYTDATEDFDTVIEMDISDLAPQITWGTVLNQVVSYDEPFPPVQNENDEKAYAYMDLKPGQTAKEIPVSHVFIGSCTNGRYSDFVIAAEILQGKKVKEGVTGIAVPGSQRVKRALEEAGIARIFIDAGFSWREAGCSLCLGMNPDKVTAYAHCASTSNRNFEGRQGKYARTHLVSPAMAALAAIHGTFQDSRLFVPEEQA